MLFLLRRSRFLEGTLVFRRKISDLAYSIMETKVPRLLLFDIDGTLTKSYYKNPESGHPMAVALSSAFGMDISRRRIDFSGGTDGTIIRDVLKLNNVTEENTVKYKEKVAKTYEILPDLMRKGIEEGNHCWTALPNVHKLLERLSKVESVRLALLTGNIEESARIKLKSASVNISLFETVSKGSGAKLLGAFGSDNEVRSKLVPIAQKRYSDYLNQSVNACDMVVIGDSPKDILCAHDNKVPCVAVATGNFSPEELSDADYVLQSFSDLEMSIQAILQTTFNCN